MTMLSLLLVMELIQPQDNNITLLEIHGELLGVIKDISRLQLSKELLESVEFNKHLFTHLQIDIQINHRIHEYVSI